MTTASAILARALDRGALHLRAPVCNRIRDLDRGGPRLFIAINRRLFRYATSSWRGGVGGGGTGGPSRSVLLAAKRNTVIPVPTPITMIVDPSILR